MSVIYGIPYYMDMSNPFFHSAEGKYMRWKPMWLMMTNAQKKEWENTQEMQEIGGYENYIYFLAKLDKEIKEFRFNKDKEMADWKEKNPLQYNGFKQYNREKYEQSYNINQQGPLIDLTSPVKDDIFLTPTSNSPHDILSASSPKRVSPSIPFYEVYPAYSPMKSRSRKSMDLYTLGQLIANKKQMKEFTKKLKEFTKKRNRKGT